jgi:cysteine desulfurase
VPPKPLYLDHNATSPMQPEAADALRAASLEFPGNPASQHQLGRQARREVECWRQSILEGLSAETRSFHSDRLIFTSGGTEANNLAVLGIARAALHRDPSRKRVILSSIEHPSVLETRTLLAAQGFDVQILRAQQNGVLDREHLAELLKEPTCLASCMLANNETGAMQPIHLLAKLCHDAGALLHTDAVQAVGKIPVHFRDLSADALTFTGHKFGGPKGIGGLILKWGVELEPILVGGFQQAGLRPGTENPALAQSLATALAGLLGTSSLEDRLTTIRSQFERFLLENIPGLVINAGSVLRLPHTSNIAFPGVNRQAFQMALDLEGVYCSTGSACASGSSEPSTVLVAMGLSEEVISSSLRFSFGWSSTLAEALEAAERILLCYKRLRGGN